MDGRPEPSVQTRKTEEGAFGPEQLILGFEANCVKAQYSPEDRALQPGCTEVPPFAWPRK